MVFAQLLAHVQDSLPVQVDRGSVEFFVDDATKQAVVFPYISVIDQLSGLVGPQGADLIKSIVARSSDPACDCRGSARRSTVP